MSLQVGQLIYTSFPDIGFQCCVSQSIPFELQQWFLQEVAHRRWDAYNPPIQDFQAAYFYQCSVEQSFFGWLYNDGSDEMGRRHIPYFISYYFKGLLNALQLETIFTCLEKGPIQFISRENSPAYLDDITIPDFCNYQPARQGIIIPASDRQQCYQNLEQNKSQFLFISLDNSEKIIQLDHPQETMNLNDDYPLVPFPSSGSSFVSIPSTQKSISMTSIEEILRELVAKPIGIEGAVLVNGEGQPITAPLGITENSAQMMAGTILYLIKNTQNELHWQGIESIAIRAKEGHLILTRCLDETFLLVKSGKSLAGLLEGEINNTVKKLQSSMESITRAPAVSLDKTVPFDPVFIGRCQLELAHYIGPVASFILEDALSKFSSTEIEELVDFLSKEIPNSRQAQQFKEKLL